MNYSGLLVSSKRGELESTLADLKHIKDVEVFQIDENASRCIVIIEAIDTNAEVDKFKEISKLPTVMDVALVVHHFDDTAQIKPIENLEQLN